jgi:hypothetical protein
LFLESLMAKKKRRKKRTTRPAAPPAGRSAERTETTRPASHRAERKEQARRERERRIKQARRRQRIRRATRWGVALAVVGGIGAFAWVQVQQDRELRSRADQAAEVINCTEIETEQDQVDAAAALSQAELHSAPFALGQGGVPATAGRHSSTLGTPPFVYDQPVPEANAVHNLEHGYVIIYYAEQGENVLAEDIRTALEALVEDEGNKVIIAPYPELANSFDLVAWGKLQTCDPPEGADPDDAVTVARAFIDQFRAGGLAPEPQGV